MASTKLLQSFKEAELQKFQHGGRFAAGQNQPIQAGKLVRLAHLNWFGAGLGQRLRVSGIVALNCQYADTRLRALFRQPPVLL